MPATSTAAAAVVTPAAGADKRQQVEVLLTDILKHMEYPARLEFKDMADGGLGVAVHFDGELPGITPNKRTYLVDCIQFLVNKVVNRPNVEKRWVTLGVNAFPEPRGPKPEPSAPPAPRASKGPSPVAAVSASAPPPVAVIGGQPKKQGDAKGAPPPARSARGNEPDEKTMKVEPSPTMARIGKTLAEKAAKHGRFYAVTLLSAEDRARVLAASTGVKGVTVRAEGEGHFRRVAFMPEKPVAIAKKSVMPDYDDE